MRILLIILLTGCAQAPISEQTIPSQDVVTCRTLSEQAMRTRALEKGGIETARAAGVAYGIAQIVPTIALSSVLPYIAAGYAITSTVSGQIEAQDRRDAIVRECLRDKGHKVY